MRIAAMILGILGGIAGVLGGGFAVTVGGLGQAFGAEGAGTVTNLGFAAVPAAILGIIGGALALSKPKIAGILMIASAVLGVIFVSAAYAIAAILLVVGGILALVTRKEPKQVAA